MVRDMSNTMKGRPAQSTQYFERIPGISYEITSRGVLSGNDINGLPITFSAFGKSFAGEITLHLKENSEHLTRVSGIEFNSGKEGKGVSGGGINASSGYEVRFYNEDNSVLSILLDKKQFDLLSNLYNQHIQAEFQKQVNFDKTKSDVIIAGHCGLPFSQEQSGAIWLNPGVIGMPANDSETSVWYMILDDKNNKFAFEHKKLAYNHQKAHNNMVAKKLPLEYAKTLLTGIWDNTEILPSQEAKQQGKQIKFEQKNN